MNGGGYCGGGFRLGMKRYRTHLVQQRVVSKEVTGEFND